MGDESTFTDGGEKRYTLQCKQCFSMHPRRSKVDGVNDSQYSPRFLAPRFVTVSASPAHPGRVNMVRFYVPKSLSSVYERTDMLTRRVFEGSVGNPQEHGGP